MLNSGSSMKAVGEVFNISKQRVKQIITQYKLPLNELYGVSVLVKERKEIYRLNHRSKYNCYPEDLDVLLKKQQKLLFRRKRNNAKQKGTIWTLEFNDLIFPKYCPILGIEIDYFGDNIYRNRENCCSFDRINPKEGYTKENTQIISYRANRIKNDASADELLKIGHYMKDLESLV